MRVKYFYPWGYFYPGAAGSDRVALNHLEYFRARGWSVDMLLIVDERKQSYEQQFRAHYHWADSITATYLPPYTEFNFQQLLFTYERAAQLRRFQEPLGRPADLFFTNYVFTSPLLEGVPPTCKRVVETVDLMTRQFSIAERDASARAGQPLDSLFAAREAFWLRSELEMYRLFDAQIMINADELSFVESQGARNAYYVPQMYPVPATPTAPQEHDYDLLFVGSAAPINIRGIRWFYENVYVPYLWQHGVRLAVVGDVCCYLDWHDANVNLLGRVSGPLEQLYASAKVVVASVLEGTGLCVKTLEGLAMGKAVVTTPQGARGLDDKANAFAKLDMMAMPRQTASVILNLLAHSRKREELERGAREYVRRCFSRDAFFQAMDRVMAAVGFESMVPHPTRVPASVASAA